MSRLDRLTPAQRQALAARVTRQYLAEQLAKKRVEPFHVPLSDYQLAPDGNWRLRLFMGGRFSGKTYAGSAWAAAKAVACGPGEEGMLVGPTFRDVRQTMVEGPSGILRILGDRVVKYNRSQWEIDLTNGSKILMRSADKLESVRGPNLSWFWADEIGSWPYIELWKDELWLALRIGENPQGMATTTPRRTPLMMELWDRHLAEDATMVLQTATAFDNPHISQIVKDDIKAMYEGTALYDQEVLGKMVLAVEGAIWSLDDIRHEVNAAEIARNGGIRQCIVVVDPSSQMDGLGDDFAIIVMCIDRKDIIWILEDKTLRGGDKWKVGEGDKLTGPGHGVKETVKAFNAKYTELDIKPSTVVFEGSGNIGGYAKELFTRIAPGLPLDFVYPTLSKGDRARAVLPLWQNDTVRHLGPKPLLEDEMTTWDPEKSKWSPNRIDAAVHGVAYFKPPQELLTDVAWRDDRLSGYGR